MVRTYSYPNNVKRDGVCIYYKKFLPVRVIHFTSIYRSPSQMNKEFESFFNNFEPMISDINTSKPSLSVILSNLNARSTSWWSNDIDSVEGTKLFY